MMLQVADTCCKVVAADVTGGRPDQGGGGI